MNADEMREYAAHYRRVADMWDRRANLATPWRQVARLVIGDRWKWAYDTLVLEGIEPPAHQLRRPGRTLVGRDRDGDVHCLHYFDDEIVEIVPPAEASR